MMRTDFLIFLLVSAVYAEGDGVFNSKIESQNIDRLQRLDLPDDTLRAKLLINEENENDKESEGQSNIEAVPHNIDEDYKNSINNDGLPCGADSNEPPNNWPPLLLHIGAKKPAIFVFKPIAENQDESAKVVDGKDDRQEEPANTDDNNETKDKISLKEFITKLVKKDDEVPSGQDLKQESIKIDGLPDYEFLLSGKPFYDSLILEKELLLKLKNLEILKEENEEINKDSSKIPAANPAYEETYKKDFVLKILNVKTAILNFLNWRTAKRLKNLYNGIMLGNYERRSMPTREFYKEVRNLLKMVQLADNVVALEAANSINTDSSYSGDSENENRNPESKIAENEANVEPLDTSGNNENDNSNGDSNLLEKDKINVVPGSNDKESYGNLPKEDQIDKPETVNSNDAKKEESLLKNDKINLPEVVNVNDKIIVKTNDNLPADDDNVEVPDNSVDGIKDDKHDEIYNINSNDENVDGKDNPQMPKQKKSQEVKSLEGSPSEDVMVEKADNTEEKQHPEYFADEDTFPYWKLWIMEQKFKLQNIGQIFRPNRRWSFFDYGAVLNSNDDGYSFHPYETATILNSKNVGTILNSRNVGLEISHRFSNLQPIYSKRGFSMLTRLRLFSLLSDGYKPERRFYAPKGPVLYLKNNNVISAETRAMLRPAGTPLRWG